MFKAACVFATTAYSELQHLLDNSGHGPVAAANVSSAVHLFTRSISLLFFRRAKVEQQSQVAYE